MRIGGFGGINGLAEYIRTKHISHVIDATHPFAAQISHNAIAACAQTNTPLLSYQRAPWQAGPDDAWCHVPDINAALAALPEPPARIFLAIGKQQLGVFARKPQHHYLVRLVDPPTTPLPLSNAQIVIARGPFTQPEDTALMRTHEITHIIAKNSGGAGAKAKLLAARTLGLPVIMVDRPDMAARDIRDSVEGVMDWLADHDVAPPSGALRGV